MREFVWPYGVAPGQSAANLLDQWRTNDGDGIRKLLHMWELTKPVIGAINGWCMGGASWYATATHMTIASENAVFGQPEVRHISNTSFFWVLSAGYKNALRYSLTGDHIDAEEALRIGIVNKIVPHDDLLEEAFQLVERIALGLAGDGEDQPVCRNDGAGDDGPRQCAETKRRAFRAGALVEPRGLPQGDVRWPRTGWPTVVPNHTRRPVPA